MSGPFLIDSPGGFVKSMRDARLAQEVDQDVVSEASGTVPSNISNKESHGSCSLDFALRWAAALGYRLALVPMDRHPFEDESVEVRLQ